ncbi:ABC transporter substrate-binding protein [Blautia schinkii]|nr:ABC transporter substrate-binding protein [Blautia schinkii]
MNKKKKILSIGVVTVLLAGLAGCSVDTGNASANTESKESSSSKNGKLTIMLSAGDSGATGVKTAFDKAAEIMGISLEYSTFPDDQFLNVLNTKGATGNLDDVIYSTANLPDIPYKELAALDGEWIEQMSDTTMPFIVNPDEGNDDILLAPIGAESNYGLAYNKKVLDKAGVEVPIMNYADFTAACEKIKAAGVTPVYLSNKEVWTAQILLQASFTGVLENQEGLVEKLVTNQVKPQDVPEIEELWQNVADLKKNGFINEDCLSATHEMGKRALANGEAAFYAVTDSVYGEIENEFPELIGDLGMTICPMWSDEKDAYVTRSSSSKRLSVNKNSENLDLAKEFVNTCMTEPVLKVFYEVQPGIAPFKDLGYELHMSEWNKEMEALAETIPVKADWGNQIYDGELKFREFWGDFTLRGQSLFADVPVKDVLEQWYTSYAESAKAKRLEGF